MTVTGGELSFLSWGGGIFFWGGCLFFFGGGVCAGIELSGGELSGGGLSTQTVSGLWAARNRLQEMGLW